MAAETDEIYREANARYHRTLAHYFAVYAWAKKLDCIIINRRQILGLLKLKSIKRVRILWFEEDVRPWFPEMRTMWEAGDRLHSIILSRHPLPEDAMNGKMTTPMRTVRLVEEGVPTSAFLGGRVGDGMPTEEEIISSMSLVANGLNLLGAIPGLGETA